jgi:trehalose 6-phosphate synthase
MQFWHIPWPAWQTIRLCPQHEEIMRGLLANDLLGFHIDRFRSNFLESVEECIDDATVDHESGEVELDGRTTVVGAHPMGVNADDIGETAETAGEQFREEFCEKWGIDPDTRIAVGVDRLDYTKGIPQRVEALELLFERHPEWRGEVTLVQKSTESRSGIPAYQEIQQEVVEAIDRINDRFGTDDWTPAIHITERVPQRDLVGLYRHGDLALVSALRDGLNLVAKEYVAAQVDHDGMLLLSEFAGAHEELDEHAVTINPHSPEEFAERIETALTMDAGERRRRMRALREQVVEHDLDAWLGEMLAATERAGRSS